MNKKEYCLKNPAIAYYSGLNGINTHGNILRLSDQLLNELKELNKASLYKKYNIDE